MAIERPPVLLSSEAIQNRVAELADQISEDYASVSELLLVGVLRGAFIFLADLSRRLDVSSAVDFLALSTYGKASTRPGAVRLVMDLRTDIADRHVLVVEDIVDTGHTLRYLVDNLSVRGPASLKTCSLLRKPDRLEVDAKVDYVGFDVPDVWVVGYGLDFDDRHRTLPYIGVITPES